MIHEPATNHYLVLHILTSVIITCFPEIIIVLAGIRDVSDQADWQGNTRHALHPIFIVVVEIEVCHTVGDTRRYAKIEIRIEIRRSQMILRRAKIQWAQGDISGKKRGTKICRRSIFQTRFSGEKSIHFSARWGRPPST